MSSDLSLSGSGGLDKGTRSQKWPRPEKIVAQPVAPHASVAAVQVKGGAVLAESVAASRSKISYNTTVAVP